MRQEEGCVGEILHKNNLPPRPSMLMNNVFSSTETRPSARSDLRIQAVSLECLLNISDSDERINWKILSYSNHGFYPWNTIWILGFICTLYNQNPFHKICTVQSMCLACVYFACFLCSINGFVQIWSLARQMLNLNMNCWLLKWQSLMSPKTARWTGVSHNDFSRLSWVCTVVIVR